MLQFIESESVQYLIVHKIDRLARRSEQRSCRKYRAAARPPKQRSATATSARSNGREFRTIAVDPERGALVKWA
jgi:hypothetical protein